jgi:catechol 2,3-dioxygenase-like lactoylglutathione lyase family enzyme
LETALYVADLDRAREFYQKLFDFETFIDGGHMCALGILGEQVLLLFRYGMTGEPARCSGEFISPHCGYGALPLCFATSYREVLAWDVRLGSPSNIVESNLRWPQQGGSLCFRDLDRHAPELAMPGRWPNR